MIGRLVDIVNSCIESPELKMTHRLRLALAVMACSGLLGACSPPPAPPPQVPAVFVSAVVNDIGSATRLLSGTLRPRIESDLGFRTGGKVSARLVELGQTVRQGQPRGRIDPDDAQLALQAAAEQVRAAEVDARQTASEASRYRSLAADGVVARQDQEARQARADAAAARLTQAQRQQGLARNRAACAVLVAPFEGVVTALRFETGQLVSEGQPVLTLARPGEMEVLVDVPESLAPVLREHQAKARLGAKPVALPLKLRELAPSAAVATRTYRARYAFPVPPPGDLLRMGMTAELQLTRDGVEASAELPLSALLSTEEQASVWLVDVQSGALTRQPVRLLSQTTDSIRVAGLDDGALVVSVGAHKLDAGMRVRPVRRPLDAKPDALAHSGARP
jgi:RND family efflux transporter MFP subunit